MIFDKIIRDLESDISYYKSKSIEAMNTKCQKGAKQVLNEGTAAFSVVIDDIRKTQKLIDYANKQGLLVEGIKAQPRLGLSSLSFFFDDGKSDVTYIPTKCENVVRDLRPRYSADDDYFQIRMLIEAAGNRKKALRKEVGGSRNMTLRSLVAKKEILSSLGAMSGLLTLAELELLRPRPMSARAASTHVQDCGQYVQIGTQVIPKGFNDSVTIIVEE